MATKNEVQSEARAAFAAAGYWGLVAMATGSGKSKIAIDESADIVKQNKKALIVLAVPTQKLRDTNWQDEFSKWRKSKIYDNNLERYCYVSINKITGKEIDLLILDEGHNITDSNSEIFENNTVKRVLVLTATPPDKSGNETDKNKVALLKSLKIETVYQYGLDRAVEDGLVAPYHINVVQCMLDSTTKYIKGGTQAKPFYQTEQQRYEYLSKVIRGMQYGKNDAVKWKLLERMRLIQNLKSKTEIARRVMNKHLQPDDRYLIFCGSIEQCESLCGRQVYHSKTKDDALNAFKAQELNRLGVVEALNEGHNIPFVDGAMIVQISSSKRDLVQRIGRTIRARAGHSSNIWIFVTVNTVDEDWFKKAVEPLDKTRITYHHYKNVI